MLDVAIRRADGSTTIDWQRVGVRAAPPLPVAPALQTLLPGGLRRGSTVSVEGSVSLLLAALGRASADGAWCALVGFPPISAEALLGYGVQLPRLALVADATNWVTAVGALLDALDIVAVRPPRGRGLLPADVRRLAARARTKDAVLMPFGTRWPGADVCLQARSAVWQGADAGRGRLRERRVEVAVTGRGPAARGRSAALWLPDRRGGVDVVAPLGTV